MLHKMILKIVMLLAGLTSFTTYAAAQPLKSYNWKNRPLIIFAPSETLPALAAQRSIISANVAGFRERDIVVIEIVGNTVRSRLGRKPGASAASLRRYYGVRQEQFRALLIGKDGGSKLQASSSISARRLFRLIDSMPMRRQEMRSRGQ